MKLEFDPNRTSSSCYYRCPECKSEFFDGGKTLHEESCDSRPGYENCICVIGPAFIERVKLRSSDYAYGPGDVSLKDIQEQLPEILRK